MTALRAIVYCRVSSKEQTQNLSLPVQEDQCRAFCGQNGWEVDRVFLERGESAKTADRTELQAALVYLREQNKRGVKIHVLVVSNLDRFARDSFDHAIVRRHLLPPERPLPQDQPPKTRAGIPVPGAPGNPPAKARVPRPLPPNRPRRLESQGRRRSRPEDRSRKEARRAEDPQGPARRSLHLPESDRRDHLPGAAQQTE